MPDGTMNRETKIRKVLEAERRKKSVKLISQEYQIPLRTLWRWYAGGRISLLWQLLLTEGGSNERT